MNIKTTITTVGALLLLNALAKAEVEVPMEVEDLRIVMVQAMPLKGLKLVAQEQTALGTKVLIFTMEGKGRGANRADGGYNTPIPPWHQQFRYVLEYVDSQHTKVTGRADTWVGSKYEGTVDDDIVYGLMMRALEQYYGIDDSIDQSTPEVQPAAAQKTVVI
jgi:hypothetical protein